MVVVVKPAVKGAVSVAVAAVDADSCPFVAQGAVESLCFAVGGRVVGPGAGMPHRELGAEVTPSVAAVPVAVVGQDAFDGDAERSEPGVGASQERDARVDGFAVEDLAVRDTAVRVDGGMDVVVADGCVAGMGDVAAAVCPPATAVGDAAQLLHIDVDELTGPAGLDAADHPSRRAIEGPQLMQSLAAKHPMDRRGVHLQHPGDASRAQFACSTQLLDSPLGASCGPRQATTRAARAIPQPRIAIATPPGPPTCTRSPARSPCPPRCARSAGRAGSG